MGELTNRDKIAIRLAKITPASINSWTLEINLLIAYFGREVIDIFILLDDDKLFERIKIGRLSLQYPQVFDLQKVKEFLYA